MTLAEKLTEVANNRPKLYNKGALDYSPQETVSGEAIGIKDISPIEHNMGVSVRGKNLIPFPYPLTSGIYKDVEVVVNDDGTIVLNGTASGTVYLTVSNKDFGNKDLYQGGKANGMILSSGNDKDTLLYYNSSNKILSYTITKDKTYDNYIVKPMIEEGTTATSYAPYIDDLSTVKLYKQGKNLLDKNSIEIITAYIDSAGLWAISADSKSFRIPCRPNTTYTLMGENPSNTVFRVGYAITEDVPHNKGANDVKKVQLYNYYRYTSFTPITITTGSNAKYLVIQLGGGEWGKNIDKLQIEIGNSATEYEPYIEPVIYDVQADGIVEGVKSLYPSTTLYTDTQGAVIDCTYYQDGKKVKENLTDMILSLGGVINE